MEHVTSRVSGASLEKRMLLYVYIYIFDIFMLFFVIKFVFLCFYVFIFHFHYLSFYFWVSNFRNRILTNKKRELVVSKCQRNCMYQSNPPICYQLRITQWFPPLFSLSWLITHEKYKSYKFYSFPNGWSVKWNQKQIRI